MIIDTDTKHMVNGVSSNDVMNLLQSQIDSGNTQTSIAVSIINQIQDQQALEGAALVKMIQQSSLDGTGSLVNIQI